MPRASKADLRAVKAMIAEQGALVDALDAGAMRALLPALNDARETLRRDLQAWLARAPEDSERFTAFQMRKALVGVQAALDRYEQLGQDMERALRANAGAAGALSAANLEQQLAMAAFRYGDPLHAIDLATASRIAAGNNLRWTQYASSAARYAGQFGEDIRRQLAVGVLRNETFAQLKQRLMTIGGVRTGDPATDIAYGFAARDRYRAERLVRTEMMHAYNAQHQEAIEHLESTREVGEDRFAQAWDASRDKRTCRLCAGLDGATAYVGQLFAGRYRAPPAHPLCRCVLIAWHPSWGMRGVAPADIS